LGEDLYNFITRYISQHVGQQKQRLQTLSGQALVKAYLEQWTHFTKSAQTVHNVFRYLDRHWIKRETDEGKGVYEVYTLHLVLWYSELFQHIADPLADAVATVVEQRRNGESIEDDTTKSLIDVIVSLELDGTDPSNSVRDIYRAILEMPIRKVVEASPHKAVPPKFSALRSIESLQESLSRVKVEDKLNAIFFGPGYSQKPSGSSTSPFIMKLVSQDLAVIEVGKLE
jgi:cullin 1